MLTCLAVLDSFLQARFQRYAGYLNLHIRYSTDAANIVGTVDRFALVIIDPTVTRMTSHDRDVFAAHLRDTGTPLVCYTRLDRVAVAQLVEWGRHCRFKTVIADFDDSISQWKELLFETQRLGFVEEVAACVESRLFHALPRTRATIRDVLLRPSRYRSALDIALGEDVAPSTLYRHFQRLSVCTPKDLLSAARLSRVIAEFSRGISMEAACGLAGYSDRRALRADTSRVFGQQPRQVRTIAPDVAKSRLLTTIFPAVGRPELNGRALREECAT